MAFTRAQFYVRFDAFDLTDYITAGGPFPNTAQDAKVDSHIASAEAQVDRTLFPTVAQADTCIMYLVAHNLSCDPSAMNSRLQKSRGDDNLYTSDDVYFKEYLRLALGVVAGYGIT
jgi:hypothetical protein